MTKTAPKIKIPQPTSAPKCAFSIPEAGLDCPRIAAKVLGTDQINVLGVCRQHWEMYVYVQWALAKFEALFQKAMQERARKSPLILPDRMR